MTSNEAGVARQYDRWLRSGALSSRGYAFLAGVPGMLLINTPAYRLNRELAIRPEHQVLDIGCGRGSVLEVLAARVGFERPPVGIDISEEMLGRTVPLEKPVLLVRGSATSLPFPAETFDLALCGYLLKHLDASALDGFLQELLRALKPGGLALVWEFCPTRSRQLDAFNRWVVTRGVTACTFRSYSAIAEAATKAGFDLVGNARLRPFLFPPIPRVSLLLGKEPEDWRTRTGPGRAQRLAQATS